MELVALPDLTQICFLRGLEVHSTLQPTQFETDPNAQMNRELTERGDKVQTNNGEGTYKNSHDAQPYVSAVYSAAATDTMEKTNIIVRSSPTLTWLFHLKSTVLEQTTTPLCQFTQPVIQLRYQKISLWNQTVFRDASTPL